MLKVKISGRVTQPGGRGITHAKITIAGGSLPSPLVLYTDRRGSYVSPDIVGGRTYTITVSQHRFVFSPSTRQITPLANVANTDFTGSSAP